MPRSAALKQELADPTTEWARDVVAGRIVAGDLMRFAAERHLRDLRNGKFHWNPEAAAEAAGFFPSVLTVTAGAKAGSPFELPHYLYFVVGSLFGWYRPSGLLRYREAWLELGKGMVKTPLSAAIGLYLMGWRGVPRSEVYAIAKDRNQASVLFNDAVALCRAPIPGYQNSSLESLGTVVLRGTGEMTWMIEHPESGSKFRVLANDEKISGPRPTMVCGDEIHEWKSMGQIELWKAALTKMAGNALLLLTTNTPAADQIAATETSDYYQGVLRGNFEDDSAFALIARVDAKDDPMNDESCWPKALPLLGVTYPIDNVRDAVKSSRHRISTRLATERLYFGVPVGASDYWIDLDAWMEVQGRVVEEEMTSYPCHLSLDLSQKNDLTALGALWEIPGEAPRVKVWYWKPKHRLEESAKNDGAQYVEWMHAGHLSVVPGATIEYDFVAQKVADLIASHDVRELTFDPAHIGEFRKACDRIGLETHVWDPESEFLPSGLKMVIHSQGRMGMHSKKAIWMPRSLQQTEDLILEKQILIDESPLTNWCCGNAAVQADAQGNKWLVKKRQRGRIDGMTAIVQAVGGMRLGSSGDENLIDVATMIG